MLRIKQKLEGKVVQAFQLLYTTCSLVISPLSFVQVRVSRRNQKDVLGSQQHGLEHTESMLLLTLQITALA